MEQDNIVLLQLNVTSVQATEKKEVTVQEAWAVGDKNDW